MLPRMNSGLTRRALIGGAVSCAVARAWAATPDWDANLVAAAKRQVGVTTVYDPAYVVLPYPGGDISRERGVCTDVVVRAYRDAFDLDLQRLVHEDMLREFSAYPARWGLSAPNATSITAACQICGRSSCGKARRCQSAPIPPPTGTGTW